MRPVSLLVGLVGGVTSGLLGVGGGIVLVPMLGTFLGLDQKRAQATSLAILVFTAIAAAIAYHAIGTVDLAMAASLALGAMLGVRLGAIESNRVPAARLRRNFGIFMLLVGIRLLLPNLPEGAWLAVPGFPGFVIEVAVGFVVGWLSGMFGVGGGVIIVPILTLLFGLPQKEAQGVSLFMIIPTSIVGAWTQLRLGAVEKPIVPPIALASIVGAVAAAAVAHRLPGPTLRFLFGLLLLGVGLRMALRPAPASR